MKEIIIVADRRITLSRRATGNTANTAKGVVLQLLLTTLLVVQIIQRVIQQEQKQ